MDYKHDINSDDDFDCSNGYNDNYSSGNSNGQTRSSNPNGLSKAELRKTNKPIMEKRRRARINHCLNELKSLILEAMKKDPARHTKLEKADILEMTVKHLQSVQRQQLNMAIQTDPSVVHKFKTGFVECAEEVNRYVSQLEGIDVAVRQRLTNHLSQCANSLEQIGSMTNFNNGYRSQMNASAGLFPSLPQDVNNNGAAVLPAGPIQMGGLQLIPSRLPSGEFALIMPNTVGSSGSSSGLVPAVPFPWPGATAVVAGAASVGPLPPGPPATLAMANPNHLNDYAQTFRMSAFSKPHQTVPNLPAYQVPTSAGAATTPAAPPNHVYHTHNSTASSPPLSPISSVSSRDGDDSLIMQTQHAEYAAHATDVVATPASNSFAGVFSTPPPTSAETSFNSSATLNSSTSSTQSAGSISAQQPSTHLQQQQVSSTSGGGQEQQQQQQQQQQEQQQASLKRERSEAMGADSSDCSLDADAPPAAKKIMSTEKSASAWRPW